MKRKLVFAAVALALFGIAAYYRYVPGQAPTGQPPLANLDQASFEQQFRAAVAGPRVLVLVSPT
ncbi:MAG TPA: hypothetical protein VNH83_01010 [Bryobacteraceae bacterium]|nr:hypothetical protein [Bryobacteraceae bacterium]